MVRRVGGVHERLAAGVCSMQALRYREDLVICAGLIDAVTLP
jgi:hypothetical protein